MKHEAYLRGVLTVIAAALLYLCILFSPLPVASAQSGRVVGAPTPGVSTGPAEMIVVGWKVPDTVPVTITRGEVQVTNQSLRVSGTVRTEQAPNTATRTVVIGWEDQSSPTTPGDFSALRGAKLNGLPVSVENKH